MVLSVYVDHPQYKVGTKLECYELSILRQMIDQETDIRLALVKNVHALVCDVNLIKRGLAVSETTIVELRQMVNGIKCSVKNSFTGK